MNALKEISKEEMVRAKQFIKCFVEKEFNCLEKDEKEIKSRELLFGYEGYKKRKGKSFVILTLPEGVPAGIDEAGNLYDLDEMFF